MKKSFMTRALAMGLSLAMAFSLSAATNVSVASAATTPAMASKQFAVRVGGATKSYKASTATQKSFKITKATVGNTDKATVKVNSSKKSIKVTPGTVTGSTVVTLSFKNTKTAKITNKKYRCVVKAAVVKEVLSVTGVAAADATTLTVTGTKLGDLTAADIKVTPEVVVSSYTAAEDGKTATVKLGAGLQSGAEYTVAVNGTDFTVKYTAGEITSVAVVETTYDDDTPGQFLAITVNGGSPITVNDLVADGYFVEFSVTSKGAAANNFFRDTTTNKSTTGVLAAPLCTRDYQVQVVLTKASKIITSPLATVKVANLDADATSFENFVLAGKSNCSSTSLQHVKLTGKTLVAKETVVLTEAAIMTADGKVKLPASVLSKVGVTSDNLNVIQTGVDKDTKETVLTAIAPGTATITFTYGSVKTTATYTVVNAGRYPASAVAEEATVRAIKDRPAVKTKVVVKDQYGELVNGLTFGNEAKIYSSNLSIASADAVEADKGGTTGADGKALVEVVGKGQGNAYLSFSYYDSNKNQAAYTAATIVVSKATEAVNAKNKLLAVNASGYSKDLTIDTYEKTKDNKVKVTLNTYTINDALVSDGASEATIPTGSYFQYDAAVVSLCVTDDANKDKWSQKPSALAGYNIASCTATNYVQNIVLEAKGKGSTVLSLYDKDGHLIASTTITVTDSTPYLTAVEFNSACPTSLTYAGETLHYTNVFKTSGSSNDPIITGITVAQPYAQLRICKTVPVGSGISKGDIYIDAASDGVYDSTDDTIIGSISVTGDATLTANPLETYTLKEGGSEKTITYTVTDKFTKKVVAAKAIKVAK